MLKTLSFMFTNTKSNN